MQKLLFFITFFSANLISAQFYKTPWVSQVEFEMSMPAKVTYSHGVFLYNRGRGDVYAGTDKTLEGKMMWGINYSINYEWFDKFYVGALGGFTYYPNPSMPVAKAGGVFRYDATEELNMDFFLSLSCFFPLTKDTEIEVGELKTGINFAIFDKDKYLLYITSYLLFADFHRATPIFGNESPDLVNFKGGGFGIGVKF